MFGGRRRKTLMHCLLCHEKISRIRHWRTKSEFCCDEHAAIHRRQTLERLVGHVASPPSDVLSILAQKPSDEGDGPDAPPLPVDSLQDAEKTALETMEVAGVETAKDEEVEPEWLPTSEETDSEAAYETASEAGDALRYEESAEDEEFVDERDDTSDYAKIRVQRDEPFPVEIATAEPTNTDGAKHAAIESSEPIEPAGASISDSDARLDLTADDARSVSIRAAADAEAAQVSKTAASDAETAEEMAQVLREAETQSSPQAVPSDSGSDEALAAALTESDEAPEKGELSVAEAKAATPVNKPARPELKGGFVLKPVKTWDPSRGRSAGKKRGMARSSGEGLSQLAQGVSERSTKAREVRREGGGKSVLVCFLPVQGGNGASTVSLHVAEAISHHLNERVLLADFDFHSGTLAFRLGLKPAHTLGDVFDWNQTNNQLWENVVCRWKKLDVLVAPPSNSSIHPHSLDKLPDVFGSALERYPYVIVDHPDAIYSSSRHILTLSDLVYLVCTPEITSLHLARRKVQQIRAMGVPGERLRLIVNRAGSWGSLGVQDIGKIVGVPVSWALNNDYAALRDAVWNGGLVQDGSELSKQLRELGWSVMGVDAPVAAESAAPAEAHSPVA
jgi:MinD-like ATPase involved in chromosome partitioning or flagellar assembly